MHRPPIPPLDPTPLPLLDVTRFGTLLFIIHEMESSV
jgi:hypothetical protein